LAFGRAHFPDEFVFQSWIWGEGIPEILIIDDNLDICIDEKDCNLSRYIDHGFIQIHATSDCLYIDLVKRPPGRLFPLEERFCSTMLPAAISEFMESTLPSIEIKMAQVDINSENHQAACKCYVRTFINMGLTLIGER
jgi:hypothetical protein